MFINIICFIPAPVHSRMIRNPEGGEPSLIFTAPRELDRDPSLFVPEEVEPGTNNKLFCKFYFSSGQVCNVNFS